MPLSAWQESGGMWGFFYVLGAYALNWVENEPGPAILVTLIWLMVIGRCMCSTTGG